MIKAKTKRGTNVCLVFNEDCCENKGGYWVEVCLDENTLERHDDFCIHPTDCDCNDFDAVCDYARKVVGDITEY